MDTFNYTALDSLGKRSSGTIEAPNRDLALQKLREEGLVPLAVQPAREPSNIEDIIARFREVPQQTLVYFVRQLATMVGSGMPTMRALSTLEEGEENPKFKAIIGKLISDVESGTKLYVAMSRHPQTFTRLFVAMVRSGEESGNLAGALRELASQLEKNATMHRAIRSALIYPKVLLGVSFLVISTIMIFILPKFRAIFESFGGSDPASQKPLPLPTRIVFTVSDFLYPAGSRNIWWLLEVAGKLALIGLLIFGLSRLLRYIFSQPGPRTAWDSFKLRAPMKIGPVVQKVVVARFARTFASLLGSGVPAVEAMEIVADTSGNVIVSSAVLKAREEMLTGSTISGPIEESGAFPPVVVRMIEIGEETGELENMLGKLADFYEEEVDISIRGLTSIIEPLMILLVGSVIGAIVISIYLPLFEIYNRIGGS